MILHGKFINVVHPKTITATPPKPTAKTSAPTVRSSTKENDEIKQELRETRALLSSVVELLQKHANAPVQQIAIQQTVPANAAVESQAEKVDIFNNIALEPDKGKELDAKIKAENKTIKRDIGNDIDLLMGINAGES